MLASHPALARPCEWVYKSTSLMSSFLLTQQCATYLVRLILIAFVMSGWCPCWCCFVGCCQNLLNTACSILVQLPSDFFSIHLVRVSVHVVHTYSSSDMTTAWKKKAVDYFIWAVWLPFDWLSIINCLCLR